MEEAEKNDIKLRLACTLRKILYNKKQLGLKNKLEGIEDISLIDNIRQLEAASGLSYTIIQQSSVGKRDIQFTSLISLIDSLKITFTDFAELYDTITEKELRNTIKEIEANKRTNKK